MKIAIENVLLCCYIIEQFTCDLTHFLRVIVLADISKTFKKAVLNIREFCKQIYFQC